MPNYVYNVVYRGKRGGVIREMEPQSFPGSAKEFARGKLLAWMADNSENANWLVVVNVWDADREGAGVAANRICQLSSRQLDEGPFDSDQIYIPYGIYYIYSVGYDFFEDDPVLAPGGTASFSGTPYGLIAPGEGPALAIRTGHEGCWISLKVAQRDAEPAADLAAWEAVEQVTIRPTGEVRVIADFVGKIEDQYPDLRGGHDTGYLAIRVSVRGRDKPGIPASSLHPRRTPLEDHLIEAWPVAGPAPHVVLKRDEFSRRWENPHGDGWS
jgi:hypothetical protein